MDEDTSFGCPHRNLYLPATGVVNSIVSDAPAAMTSFVLAEISAGSGRLCA